jgi:creatinine amidohydrolase
MPEREIFLERMTRPQVEAALNDGFLTVVVPCGAVEQHGPHLPLFVDAEIGTRLGEEVARRLGKTLVAPTVRIGCSEHHMAFAGTLTLRETTFKAVCLDYCTSLARHGFKRICMLPSHGGNFKPIADALDDLNAAVGPGCQVCAYTDLVALVKAWMQAVDSASGLGERVGGHADIAESSVMLCLFPELVDQKAAAAGFAAELSPDLVERIMRDGMSSVTPNGILGDARGMSEEIGNLCIAAAAELAAEFFLATSPPLSTRRD